MRKSCSACLMPYAMDTGTRASDDYCSYCQKQDGTFAFAGTRREFQKMCYRSMREKGIGWWKAHFFAWMIRFAPQWKAGRSGRSAQCERAAHEQ